MLPSLPGGAEHAKKLLTAAVTGADEKLQREKKTDVQKRGGVTYPEKKKSILCGALKHTNKALPAPPSSLLPNL